MKGINLWMAIGALAAGLSACASTPGRTPSTEVSSQPSGEGTSAQPLPQASSPAVNGLSGEEAYHKISAEEAKAMMEEGGVTVVDVRTAEEYREGHVPGAILAPNETIAGQAAELLPDQSAVLLVYCRTGRRSKQASDRLVELGYRNVYDFGGIVDWTYETAAGSE